MSVGPSWRAYWALRLTRWWCDIAGYPRLVAVELLKQVCERHGGHWPPLKGIPCQGCREVTR